MSEDVFLYEKWTGQTHINFIRGLNGQWDIADKLIKRLDFNPTRKIKNLSAGNRQKLGIIMAFMFEPEILILDEPTKSLDPLLQNMVYDLIQKIADKKTAVFISSHNLAEVERICDRVGIIRQGRLVATESFSSLKEKKIYTVCAYFFGEFNKEDFVKKV